ncbi:MAG: tripartite tricarboxylate transporter substrate binding protein, partial [Burkholderiales bacterium]|nr:tripartite tricarboxylate transporter substrate binding protein [Burkholderiales bacterium]
MRILAWSIAACLAAVAAGPAAAQTSYPTRIIRIISPFPPGGNTDRMARIIGAEMTRTWGQNVVVENRAGGGGIVGTEVIARAPADGHTMGIIISSHAVHPALHSRLPFDPAADFSGLSLLLRVPHLFTAHPSLPARTLKELIDLAKRHPGKITYATAGVGTGVHLAGELLNALAKVEFTPVHYKGGGPGVQDLLGGQITMSVNNVNVTLPYVRSQRVRGLAVTSPQRTSVLPDVMAMAEMVPGYDMSEWYGMVGPKGIPRDVVLKIQGEIARILNEPKLKQMFRDEGVDLVGGSPEEMNELIR